MTTTPTSSAHMQVDFEALAKTVVAITYPVSGRPTMLQSSYHFTQWPWMVKAAFKNMNGLGARLIYADSDEGQAILNEIPTENLTLEYLVGLDDGVLRGLAEGYGVKPNGRSTKKSIALGILKANMEGVRPKEEVKKTEA